MLILHVPDALKHAAPNSIAQVFGCRLWVDVTQIDCPVHSLNASHPVCHIASAHHVNAAKCGSVGCERRKAALSGRHRLLSDQGLSRRGLSLLGGHLLRLRDVGTAVLSVINSFTCPRWFGGQSINNLNVESKDNK